MDYLLCTRKTTTIPTRKDSDSKDMIDTINHDTIGLIAGGGDFPIMCAEAARRHGKAVIAVAHKGETSPDLNSEVDHLEWIYLGQLGRLIKTFKKYQVKQVIFAGTIKKKRIFSDIRPDLRALSLWKKLRTRLDDGILRALADELESEGIHVISSVTFLTELLVPEGLLSKKKPSKQEWEDIKFGWGLAKKIGQLDIGQCIVVKHKTVLAVEAIEGTDETITRGGKLGGPGGVIIKVCKPTQDTRFDLPATGPDTIKTMASVSASVLAVEANKALLFKKEETIKLANKLGISIVGIKEA